MDQLERKEKYIRIVIGIVALITILFGAMGAYISDQASIAQNSKLIHENVTQIRSIRAEFRAQTDKQSSTMQQILIKVTRLETKIETLIKR